MHHNLRMAEKDDSRWAVGESFARFQFLKSNFILFIYFLSDFLNPHTL